MKRLGMSSIVALAGILPAMAGEGFVTVAADAEGRWSFRDGSGKPYVHRGVGWVSPRGPRNAITGKSDYQESVRAKYSGKDAWETNTVARLRRWGFNAVGSDSSPSLFHRGLRHTILLRMGAAPATWKRDPDDYVMPHKGHPCSAFPNVFSPRFAAQCDEVAAKSCAPNRNDRDLVGYFIDNELAWWGAADKGRRNGTGLVDAVARLPPQHTARLALAAFAESRGETLEKLTEPTKEAFLEQIAERYFAVTADSIRKADPNHLVLGCRFAGIRGTHPVVWKAAGRHCDVVTANIYPTVDFKTRQMSVGASAGRRPFTEALRECAAWTKRPLMITEWSFPARDSGLPCTHGAGQRLKTQGERATAAETFVRTVETLPFMVGYDFFMWTDMPNPRGAKDYRGEDCNYGLVNGRDEPYETLVTRLAAVQRGARWRVTVGGVPLPLETVDISIKENNEPAENKRLKGDWFQFGSFTLDEPVEVRIACDRPLKDLEILPAKFEIHPVPVATNEIAFIASKPFRLAFRPEGRVGALHLFANGKEACGVGGVIRFGPGEHIRTNIAVRSNQTLFLDEGAKVFGHLDVRGTNVTVCGSGLISGARFARHKGPVPFSNAIVNATNVTIRGVTFTDPYTWTLGVKHSRHVVFENVKILGGRMINDDGIDVINSSDVTIRDSFIRTQDDNICAKGLGYEGDGVPFAPVENLLVEGCELWTDQANNFRIGFECDAAHMRNIRIRDVDILATSPIARPTNDLWCHAVVKAQAGGDLAISGLDVRDVRVRADGNDVCLVYLQPHKTWSGRRGQGRYHYKKCGTIRDCRFADIDVTGRKDGFTGWIYLDGPSPAECVSNVIFDAVRYFGEPVTAKSRCVRIAGAVHDVRFRNGEYTVRAPRPKDDWTTACRDFTNATELIQGAIDRAFRSGGARVSVKRGYYPIRGLRLRSGVELHLEAGAFLQASRLPQDFDILKDDRVEPVDFEAEANKLVGFKPVVPVRRTWVRTSMCDATQKWNNGIIRVLNAHDVSIVGEEGSVIDGANSYDPTGEEGYRGVHGISGFDVTNLTLKGFTLQHTGNWAIRLQRCADVLGEDLTMLGGHDGFHTRAGERVRVRRCRIDTGDDGIAGFDNHDMVVEDCTISSACSAFRLGGNHIRVRRIRAKGPASYLFRGSLGPVAKRDGLWDPSAIPGRRSMATFFLYFCDVTVPLRHHPGDIVFEDCEISDCARFIRYNFGGETWQHAAPMTDVTFVNCRARGLWLPLALNAAAAEGRNVPLKLTMRHCALGFSKPQREVFSAVNVGSIDLERVTVSGAYAPLVRHWAGEPKLRLRDVTGYRTLSEPATGRFTCPMR